MEDNYTQWLQSWAISNNRIKSYIIRCAKIWLIYFFGDPKA